MKTLKDINWNQVYCFYEVARKLSMKEAAAVLGVSTPTVSEQIKRLEEQLHITLFRRLSRKIELTREGAALYVCAKEMFEVGNRLLDSVTDEEVGGYTVKVGIQETLATPIAADFVNQYWDVFAPFGVVNTGREEHSETLATNLLNGIYDWGISFVKPTTKALSYQKIATCELVFCCSPQIFELFKEKEDILRKIPLARCTWDNLLNETIDDHLRIEGIFPDEVIESDHLNYVISLAQRGRCVAIYPKQSLVEASWSDSVVAFALEKPMELTLYAIWASGNDRKIAIKKLIELLNLADKPEQMNDPELQVRVNPVDPELLERQR